MKKGGGGIRRERNKESSDHVYNSSTSEFKLDSKIVKKLTLNLW